MEIPKLQSQVKASVLPFDKLAGNPNVAQGDKIKEAARQFEAVLVRQMLQEMHKTNLAPDKKSNSNISSIYNDMVDNQTADGITRAGGFGLAKSLQTELAHQILPKTAGTETAPPLKATVPAATQK